MVDVVIATRNPHKIRELKGLLAIPGIRWHSLAEFPDLRVAEEGKTFEDNAVKKARVIARATGWLTLADDSGVEVDALGGAPGVRSARFAGRHGDDAANNDKVLRQLAGRPPSQRTARYRCVLALGSPTGLVALARGQWAGRIASAPSGHHGFGYDPIFLVPRYRKTVGQLPTRVKQRLSHRAAAARRLRSTLRRVIRSVRLGRVVPQAPRLIR